MRKLIVLGGMLVMLLVAAAPVIAQEAPNTATGVPPGKTSQRKREE